MRSMVSYTLHLDILGRPIDFMKVSIVCLNSSRTATRPRPHPSNPYVHTCPQTPGATLESQSL